MRRDKADAAYLWDMFEAAKSAVQYTRGKTFEDYLGDGMLRHAVERVVEIIGEAARKVSDEYREQHPEIPWQKIIAQRHIVAHEYDDLQDHLIWIVATERAVDLVRLLEPLIPPPPPIDED